MSSEEVSSEERPSGSSSIETGGDGNKGDLGVPDSFEAEDREFTYYPVAEKVNGIGNVVYEVIDEVRSARGGNKKGKKKCKSKKKSKKKKGKKKSKSKSKGDCGAHGGWWYVWDKKHGYISGRFACKYYNLELPFLMASLKSKSLFFLKDGEIHHQRA